MKRAPVIPKHTVKDTAPKLNLQRHPLHRWLIH